MGTILMSAGSAVLHAINWEDLLVALVRAIF